MQLTRVSIPRLIGRLRTTAHVDASKKDRMESEELELIERSATLRHQLPCLLDFNALGCESASILQ